jgi:tRNA A37 threonylcarbamoyladenosine synthetase subunit TsaC/SUA5/YrdC
MLQLVATVGPIAATGAGIVGEPLPIELSACDTTGISIGLDAGQLPGGPVSTVVDLRKGVDVVREGAISAAEIAECVG